MAGDNIITCYMILPSQNEMTVESCAAKFNFHCYFK